MLDTNYALAVIAITLATIVGIVALVKEPFIVSSIVRVVKIVAGTFVAVLKGSIHDK